MTHDPIPSTPVRIAVGSIHGVLATTLVVALMHAREWLGGLFYAGHGEVFPLVVISGILSIVATFAATFFPHFLYSEMMIYEGMRGTEYLGGTKVVYWAYLLPLLGVQYLGWLVCLSGLITRVYAQDQMLTNAFWEPFVTSPVLPLMPVWGALLSVRGRKMSVHV